MPSEAYLTKFVDWKSWRNPKITLLNEPELSIQIEENGIKTDMLNDVTFGCDNDYTLVVTGITGNELETKPMKSSPKF